VLISTKDGEVIRNLTTGFDQERGFEYISTPGGRFISVPFMSWAPAGDRLAYFVRTEKDRSLVLQNVLTRKTEIRVAMNSVDAPESPDISPDGQTIAFSAMRNGVADIFTLNLDTREIVNLTNDAFADYAPTWSPDGKSLICMSRVSGNEKLFRVDVPSGNKTQLTFGTHDDAAAQFLDAATLIFPSTATDPAQAIEPEVARNGNIYNLWTLNLGTGELRQFTDALSGNVSPVLLREGSDPRVAFVTYYKGEYGLHVLERRDPINQAASADFGAPGPIIDFQAPMTHTLVAENKKKKGRFEKLFLEGRPPLNVGVTSGGDFFGGTQIAFADVLGDQQFSMFAASVSQYRTLSFAWLNLERRFQFALQGYSQTQFFYGQLENVFYDPSFSGIIDRDFAVATRTLRGGTAFGIYPLNRYRRLEVYGGAVNYQEQFDDPGLESYSETYQQQQFGQTLFNNGTMLPLGLAFIQETTIFREFGPLAGSTMRLGYEIAPKVGNTLTRQTIDVDARKYYRIAGSGLLAMRARGFRSWGDNPDFMFFGGNSELRGYDYLSFVGQDAFFLNAEVRFPLINALATPIGILGGIRGTFFANLGGASFGGRDFTLYSRDPITQSPVVGYQPNNTGGFTELFGEPRTVDGFKLVDGRASYGISLQTFALGFPVHFDWSWKSLFNREYEDVVFSTTGGSSAFRKPKFTMWIGYDF